MASSHYSTTSRQVPLLFPLHKLRNAGSCSLWAAELVRSVRAPGPCRQRWPVPHGCLVLPGILEFTFRLIGGIFRAEEGGVFPSSCPVL